MVEVWRYVWSEQVFHTRTDKPNALYCGEVRSVGCNLTAADRTLRKVQQITPPSPLHASETGLQRHRLPQPDHQDSRSGQTGGGRREAGELLRSAHLHAVTQPAHHGQVRTPPRRPSPPAALNDLVIDQAAASFFSQISDPHGFTTLHHQTQPAQLPALTHGHPAREAPRGRLRHAPGGQVAPGLLQVRRPADEGRSGKLQRLFAGCLLGGKMD